MRDPSGVHFGSESREPSSDAIDDTLRTSPLVRSYTKRPTSGHSCQRAVKRTFVPSGDTFGCTFRHVPNVSCTRLVPSASMIHRFSPFSEASTRVAV